MRSKFAEKTRSRFLFFASVNLCTFSALCFLSFLSLSKGLVEGACRRAHQKINLCKIRVIREICVPKNLCGSQHNLREKEISVISSLILDSYRMDVIASFPDNPADDP